MQLKILLPFLALCLFAGRAQAQWVVLDPSNLAQGIANAAKQVVQASQTAANTVNTFKETSKIYEQGKKYYETLQVANGFIKDARKVQKTALLVEDITNMYLESFGKMRSDPHFKVEELSAIASGYTILLKESADMLSELKSVIRDGAFSMNDSERMGLINQVYERVKRHHELVSYYTRKNISVSYLRARKAGDSDRIRALYGNAEERYW
ncbi:hypothetical protein EZS27_016473 [termite gut metagenome]|uniref:DUF4141 domain-containing protein n=1 Tax=termite gut metagenome TaxID=433724 RepID=A0A5J4RNI2_9ZZZZ